MPAGSTIVGAATARVDTAARAAAGRTAGTRAEGRRAGDEEREEEAFHGDEMRLDLIREPTYANNGGRDTLLDGLRRLARFS